MTEEGSLEMTRNDGKARNDKNMGKNDDKMALTARGIKLMIGGLLVMAAGFILLAGGGSDDPQVFNYAMFDFRRLVAAPVVIVAGIVLVVVAIMRRPKDKKGE